MIQHSTSGYIPKVLESRLSKRYLCSHVHSSINHNCQRRKHPSVLVDEWITKCGLHIEMECHSALNRKKF